MTAVFRCLRTDSKLCLKFGDIFVICNLSHKTAHFYKGLLSNSFDTWTEKNKTFTTEIQTVLFIIAAFSQNKIIALQTIYSVELDIFESL